MFTGPHRRERDVHMLEGAIRGIAYNDQVSQPEANLLAAWANLYITSKDENLKKLATEARAIADAKVITPSGRSRLLNACREAIGDGSKFRDDETVSMQQLHGILGAIAVDGTIDRAELGGIRDWIREHENLRALWPYDEVDAILTGAYNSADKDELLEQYLLAISDELLFNKAGLLLEDPADDLLNFGVCAACPNIQFLDSVFCFTGTSSHSTRRELQEQVESLGGEPVNNMSDRVHYVVSCDAGSRGWAYKAYGRKIEYAMQRRKEGVAISIIHENDFWDAVQDL
jgi:hypothetical protein